MDHTALKSIFKHNQAERTLKVGKSVAVLALIFILFFTYFDYYHLDLQGTLPWRVISFFGFSVFLAASFFIKEDDTILNLYAMAIGSAIIMMLGIAFQIFTDDSTSELQRVSVTVGNLTIWFVLGLVTIGIRSMMPYIGGILLLIFIIALFQFGAHSWGYTASIVMIAAFSIIMMQSQERGEFEKFTYLHRLERNEKELLVQKRELELMNEELVSFNYSISHDLRTPLRAANSFSQLMVRDIQREEYKSVNEYAGFISSNLKKMHQLLEDLLNLSQIGKKKLIFKHIDVEKEVKELWPNLIREETKNPKLVTRSLPKIKADPGLIEQVLINLLANAIKYSRNVDTPTVEVGGYEQDHFQIIYVKDNGCGFNEKFKDKLFQVFKRLHTDEEYEGTGVGLAIVKRIVNYHGGDVWGESKINEGATFYFSVPK